MAPSTAEDVDDDRGVTPVIGVVLMVALTVVLASASAVSLYGLATEAGVDAPVPAAVAVDGGDGIAVTWVGNSQADKLRVEFMADGNLTVVFLRRVGSVVTLDPAGIETTGGQVVHGGEPDVDRGEVVQITVSAQADDQRTLLVRRTARV